jgi:hypothetical protein
VVVGLAGMCAVVALALRLGRGRAPWLAPAAVAGAGAGVATVWGVDEEIAVVVLAGGAAATLGMALRRARPRLGSVGVALGFDLAVLVVATWLGVDLLVVTSGAVASILAPVWWLGLAVSLQGGADLLTPAVPAPVVLRATSGRRETQWVLVSSLQRKGL